MVFLQQTADVEEIDLQAARLECELKREESDLTEGKEDYEILFNEFFDLFWTAVFDFGTYFISNIIIITNILEYAYNLYSKLSYLSSSSLIH